MNVRRHEKPKMAVAGANIEPINRESRAKVGTAMMAGVEVAYSARYVLPTRSTGADAHN